jgi:hypothetical protein
MHAARSRSSAPFLSGKSILLKHLWEKASEETRRLTLQTLSQIVARQLLPAPDPKEVRHEDC